MLYSFTYHFTSFVTSGHQKFLVTSSIIFYYPLCSFTGISWCNQMISILSFLSLGIYTFLSLYITLLISLYSSSLIIFTPAHFISFTTLITLSSFTFDYFTFSSKPTSSIITSTFSIFLTSNYSSLTNISSSLFFLLLLSSPVSCSNCLPFPSYSLEYVLA